MGFTIQSRNFYTTTRMAGQSFLTTARKEIFTRSTYRIDSFGIKPENPLREDFNPFIVYWVVDRSRRKQLSEIVQQGKSKPVFSKYGQALLDAQFKNW